MLVVFDVVGTLFSLDKIKARFHEVGLPGVFVQVWFAKLLQTAFSATLAGAYVPFKDAAESTLSQVLALGNIDEDLHERIAASLGEIEPWDDAAACLQILNQEGHRLVALTNSSRFFAERMLLRSGLRGHFEKIFSTDEVKACKPHPASYQMVLKNMSADPKQSCMVAAHGWDILGASAVGMNTVYVTRLEKRWPLPIKQPSAEVETLRDVPASLLREFPEVFANMKKAG